MSETIKAHDLPSLIGQELEPSSWLEITQERVNQFADATSDHQFIHIDVEKAAQTPFGGTIAHGFLTLSLISFLCAEKARKVEGVVMGINYGSDKVRFLQPVRVGSRIRARQVLLEATEKNPGQWLTKTAVTIEIENQEKPVMIAESLAIIIVR
ncbi:MAG: MaoC family dehydratase [Xanthomonadales bacterium]|jgi:acyl dehydratase|nr:MaoC family dehydratase [Xanthomonadales bacterium]